MKRSYTHFLALLILIPLVLSACGGSSSNHEVTASQYPYGADGFTTVAADGESTYNQTFEYNSALQVIGQNIEYTSYDDNVGGDPVIDYRRVYNYTYDPSITVASLVPTNLTPVAQKTTQYGNFGAVLSNIERRYEVDDETGILGTSPSYQREYHYSYTNSGLLLEQTEVESENNETTSRTYTYTYNSAEDITSYTYTRVDPEGTSSTTIKTYSYDSYGNLISYIRTVDGDVEYEETYTHSYTNGLRMKTVVTTNVGESNEDTYQTDFLYNAQEQLISKTKSTDEYNDDGEYISYTTNTYTYDSSGRLLTDSEERYYDSNGDDTIDDLYREYLVWEYNEQGLMTTSSRETCNYSDPIAETLSSHYKYINSYGYTESGNIAMRSKESLLDAELDGVFEGIIYARNYEYSYNDAGYLIDSTYERNDYSGGAISSTEAETNVITYADGVLTQTVEVDFDDGSETSRSSLTFAYDDNGQLVQIASEDITYTLTYNDDQTVTVLYEKDETELQTMIVDFTSEGVPTGSADFSNPEDSIRIEYPNSPEIDVYYSGEAPADANDKSYPIVLKMPKMFVFAFNGMAK